MEDFLKDRPVLDPKSALVLAAESKPAVSSIKPPTAASGPAPAASPFGDLRRDPVAAGKPAAPAAAGAAASTAAQMQQAAQAQPQALKGEHGTKVQTIVERGRVVKIIVTCTCGKVTEIACQY
jgi:hypothetical protein